MNCSLIFNDMSSSSLNDSNKATFHANFNTSLNFSVFTKLTFNSFSIPAFFPVNYASLFNPFLNQPSLLKFKVDRFVKDFVFTNITVLSKIIGTAATNIVYNEETQSSVEQKNETYTRNFTSQANFILNSSNFEEFHLTHPVMKIFFSLKSKGLNHKRVGCFFWKEKG